MGFEPQKFFIGLMEFFAILLPGGLVMYLVKDSVGPAVLGNAYFRIEGAEAWIVLLFGAYLFGHLVFLLGSFLLDDVFYERVRNATDVQQIRRLGEGEKPASQFTRWLAGKTFTATTDRAVTAAARIKKHYLAPLDADDAINAFQWSKARLVADGTEALSIVQRFEADSKFFRSLCIVIVFFAGWSIATGRPYVALASVVFLALSLWRYKDQRVKATTQAYWYVIAVEAAKKDGFRSQRARDPDAPTHAGGVVVRRDGDVPRFLLIHASDSETRWVLPKGHIEADESAMAAAVREVREEAGVWARVLKPMSRTSYLSKGSRVDAQFYLMEAHVHDLETAEHRAPRWLPLEEAVTTATHDETKELLRQGAALFTR